MLPVQLLAAEKTLHIVSSAINDPHANGVSETPVIAVEGRYIVFASEASNLVNNDNNGLRDVFLHDRFLDVTELISTSSTGETGNGNSYVGDISPDGRYIVFSSESNNLVPHDVNQAQDVFIHDAFLQKTERISTNQNGIGGSGISWGTSISANGRYVTYFSLADNLVSGDNNDHYDVFVYDRWRTTTQRITASHHHDFVLPQLSADGRYIVYQSSTRHLTLDNAEIYRYDRWTGATQLVSAGVNGMPANDGSFSPDISADGRFIVFYSSATNLVQNDMNTHEGIFVRDMQHQQTQRINQWANGGSSNPHISADSSTIVFTSTANNLTPNDTNNHADIFAYSLSSGETKRVSVSVTTRESNAGSQNSSITANGQLVAFQSDATNLTLTGNNPFTTIFVRDIDFNQPACTIPLSGPWPYCAR